MNEEAMVKAEKWFRENDSLNLDPESEGYLALMTIWSAFKEGYMLSGILSTDEDHKCTTCRHNDNRPHGNCMNCMYSYFDNWESCE